MQAETPKGVRRSPAILRRALWLMIVSTASIGGVTACSDMVTPPTSPAYRGGPLTIAHGYKVYPTTAEFREARRRHFEEAARYCEVYAIRGGAQQDSVAFDLPPVVTIGQAVDWGWIAGQFRAMGFGVPAWQTGIGCLGTGNWWYGNRGDVDIAIIDSGYGTLQEGEAPPEVPANIAVHGVTQEEWERLTTSEKLLLVAYAASHTAAQTGTFIATLKVLRDNAYQVSDATGLPGEEDGQRDAFRHAYWQCSMTKTFGAAIAKLWGDAHESENLFSPRALMDLRNNARGRAIAAEFSDCQAGVWTWLQNGALQTSLDWSYPNSSPSGAPRPENPLVY